MAGSRARTWTFLEQNCPLFCSQNNQYTSKLCAVALTLKILHLWGPLWGHFGNNLVPFRADFGQFRTLWGMYWSHFVADFTPFSGQKWPKYPQIMYCCTGHQHTVLWGAFGGHSWLIRAILGLFRGPIQSILAVVWTISPLFADKKGLIHICGP